MADGKTRLKKTRYKRNTNPLQYNGGPRVHLKQRNKKKWKQKRKIALKINPRTIKKKIIIINVVGKLKPT